MSGWSRRCHASSRVKRRRPRQSSMMASRWSRSTSTAMSMTVRIGSCRGCRGRRSRRRAGCRRGGRALGRRRPSVPRRGRRRGRPRTPRSGSRGRQAGRGHRCRARVCLLLVGMGRAGLPIGGLAEAPGFEPRPHRAGGDGSWWNAPYRRSGRRGQGAFPQSSDDPRAASTTYREQPRVARYGVEVVGRRPRRGLRGHRPPSLHRRRAPRPEPRRPPRPRLPPSRTPTRRARGPGVGGVDHRAPAGCAPRCPPPPTDPGGRHGTRWP